MRKMKKWNEVVAEIEKAKALGFCGKAVGTTAKEWALQNGVITQEDIVEFQQRDADENFDNFMDGRLDGVKIHPYAWAMSPINQAAYAAWKSSKKKKQPALAVDAGQYNKLLQELTALGVTLSQESTDFLAGLAPVSKEQQAAIDALVKIGKSMEEARTIVLG